MSTPGARATDPGTWWRSIPALAVTLLFLAPVLVMLVGSLRLAGSPPARTITVPWPPAFGNYARVAELADLWRAVGTSAFVAGIAVPIAVVVASWTGFAIARASSRGRAALVTLCVVVLVVPPVAQLVGRFWVFRSIGAIDSFVPLIAPALLGVTPVSVLLFAWAFGRIPSPLIDTCRLEGFSALRTWRTVLPLVRPVAVAAALLAFLATWGDFLSPLIYLFDQQLATLPLALRELTALDPPDAPLLLAGAVVASVPAIAVVAAGAWILDRNRRGISSGSTGRTASGRRGRTDT